MFIIQFLKEDPMLKYKEGVDILSDLGGVKTIAQAQEIFRQKLNPEHQKRLTAITCENYFC